MLITRARIYIQRLFDIAEEINLSAAQNLVSDLSRRPKFAGSTKHIQLPDPPLEINLGPRTLPIPIVELQTCEVTARLYEVGALSVTFAVDLPPCLTPERLIELACALSAAEDDITTFAQPICQQISTAVTKACKPGEIFDVSEEYVIFYIQATDPKCEAASLGEYLDIPRLLLAETGKISKSQREQLDHTAVSYRPDDLVVIDWNAALVVEPTFAVDIPELLELVSVQMLELRTYDALVASSLRNLYVTLDDEKQGFFRSSHYVRLSRRVMKLYVDIMEITERIDNALTFLGDTYLAKVHRIAVSEFGIPHWQNQLRNKLEVLRQINDIIIDQITSEKSLNIEILIAMLIVLEVVMGVVQLFRF